MKTITRDEAFTLLKKYNKDPFHIQHALTVEAVMKWYASELGYGEDAEYWGIVVNGSFYFSAIRRIATQSYFNLLLLSNLFRQRYPFPRAP